VIALGLASRSRFSDHAALLAFSRSYVGDVLYAVAVLLLIALFKPHWSTWRLVAVAVVCCFVIELSQLYDAPWASAVRASTAGALIFGRGFSFSDLLCYVVGAGAGALVDRLARTSG